MMLPAGSGAIPASLWGPDGKELYFVNDEGMLVEATVHESVGRIRVARVRPLFLSPFLPRR